MAHYTANEFNYDTPDWLGDTTVVITASLGGSTPETVKANSVAKPPVQPLSALPTLPVLP